MATAGDDGELHQLGVERMIELERSIDNTRQQLRSVSALYSTEKKHVQVLKYEVETLWT